MFEFLQWQVQDVMSKPVTIGPGASLAEVEALLESEGFNAVPVVDAEDRLLGLVTSLDLLAAFTFGEDTILPPFDQIMLRPVAEIMSRDVVTVCPRTPLTRVLEKIIDRGRKSLPVVEDDRVVGMVAREDVMNALRRAGGGEAPPQPSRGSQLGGP